MKKTWTDQDALDLIEKVEGMFMTHLADMKPLNKSEEKAEDEKKDEKDESKKDESGEAVEMSKSEPAAEASAPAATDEVEELYKSMSDEEKKSHYETLKKVMAGQEMKKSEEAAAPKEEPKKDDAAVLAKAEIEALKATVEEQKKQNEELKKNLDGVVAALSKKFVKPAGAPKQKAITELGALNKSETKEASASMTDKEIRKVLSERAKEPTLKKSDRDAINAYCFGKVDVSAVKHLIG